MKRLPQYSHEDLQPYGDLPDGVPALYPPFGEFKQWKVQKAFRYISKEGWVILVHRHFMSDLASLWKILRLFFGANARESLAAVIHDNGYRNNTVEIINIFTGEKRTLTRKEWDMIFHDVMGLGRAGRLRRNGFYHGARLGGWAHENWRGK